MIKAEIVADSKNEFGQRITTFVVTFPRYILAELNTHRMFSRNSASSRAIPFEKMLKSVEENPFVPIAWQEDHKGMQGTVYLGERDVEVCTSIWLQARNFAVQQAKALGDRKCTKQFVNRLLEPYMWHTVIITATEWENFFALRCPQYKMLNSYGEHIFRSRKDYLKNVGLPDEASNYDNFTEVDWLKKNAGMADIHMMTLAEAIWDAYNESKPVQLQSGEWHIPFGDKVEKQVLIDLIAKKKNLAPTFVTEHSKAYVPGLVKIATARCARVSYTVVGEEGKPDNYENDFALHDRLASSGHWSPFEHCAKAMTHGEFDNSFHKGNSGDGPDFYSNGWSGNFRGFIQYRKTFSNENIK